MWHQVRQFAAVLRLESLSLALSIYISISLSLSDTYKPDWSDKQLRATAAAAAEGLARAVGPPSRHLAVTNAEHAGSEMVVCGHAQRYTQTIRKCMHRHFFSHFCTHTLFLTLLTVHFSLMATNTWNGEIQRHSGWLTNHVSVCLCVYSK